MSSRPNDYDEENEEIPEDNEPLLEDIKNSAVKKMIARGKERGFITYDELNEVLPEDEFSSEQIEETMAIISDMGINLVESEDELETQHESIDDNELVSTDLDVPQGNVDDETSGRSDDPVRMYLKEMGNITLLSREDEIEIAKRIEEAREQMISGLCESPLTMKAIVEWRDELVEGTLFLRDIIDLEAMYGMDTPPVVGDDDDEPEETVKSSSDDEEDKDEDKETSEDDEDEEGKESSSEESTEEDFDSDGNHASLAAMEEALKPQVLDTFEKISTIYAKLQKLQGERLAHIQEGKKLTKVSEDKYTKMHNELVEWMQTIRLNGNMIDRLVDQLAGLHERLRQLEGRLLRYAEKSKVKREEFIKIYMDHELETDWEEKARKLKGKGWETFFAEYGDKITEIRDEISQVCTIAALPISEFRRVVQKVQRG